MEPELLILEETILHNDSEEGKKTTGKKKKKKERERAGPTKGPSPAPGPSLVKVDAARRPSLLNLDNG